MKHAAWSKNQRREVRRTLGRYLAILAIVALGVGFFSGLKVTKSAMLATGDAYLASRKMYDEELLTTLGVTEDDVSAIRQVPGVTAAEGAVSADFLALLEDGTSPVLAAHSITKSMNLLSLTAGRMPQKADECVADAREFSKSDIGGIIRVSDENDEDTKDAFACDAYTIVGIGNSVTYLNMERGSTKLSGGRVTAFVFIPKEGFSLDYDTAIYATIQGGDEPIFSDAYDDAASAMEQPLKDELTRLANARYRDLTQEAQEKIDEAETDYNDGLTEYNDQKAEADSEFAENWETLEDARISIAQGWGTFYRNESDLNSARADYEAGLAAYTQGLSDFSTQKSDAEAEFTASQQAIDAQRPLLEAALAAAELSGDPEQIAYYQGMLGALDAAQGELDAQKSAAEAQFALAQAQLDGTKAQLDTAAATIDAGTLGLRDAKHALISAGAEYDEGVKAYFDAKAEADQKLRDAKKELEDGRKKIDDAKAELADLEEPDCYVLGRDANVGYTCYENDSAVVEGISKVFPIFFFLVAALVCMTTMARMVEEQRTQIGTLKALGYGNGAIAWKFISYSASAATLGCGIGFFGGSWLFPYVIWQAYGMLYGFAPILYVIDWGLFAISLAVSLACSAGVTYLTCRAEMTLMPAELMRPKAPKQGKRIWLERIPFIWNRLSFLKKISLRNVFRYTQRLIMMMLGIGGCTAMLLTGFGVRDSIANIATDQFETITKYDYAIAFDTPKTETERALFTAQTKQILQTCVFVCADTLDAPSNEGTKNVNVLATGDPAITQIFELRANGNTVPYPGDGGVVISKKLSRVTGAGVGDEITVRVDGTRTTTLPVTGVFENYVYYYMLMTPNTYETVCGQPCEYKAALATSAATDEHAAAAKLISDYGAANVTVTADIQERVNNMMVSLDYVVYLVIASAAALAFVVLFNLSNINITERVREIATIKVLGFYAPEVGAYVFRENLILTAFGALIGVPMGVWLHRFVMGQLSFDMVDFKVVIAPLSFAIALAMTFIFTFSVDILLRRKLGKIDMVESLKAIE